MRTTLILLSIFTLAAFLLAACGDDTPSATSEPPRTSIGDRPIPGQGAYVALGDSLSVGVGATAAEKTFVSLIHEHLGAPSELINLGHSGDTSDDLLQTGKLGQAIETIADRENDNDPANDVALITLEIGGNDLLHIYASQVRTGICPNVEAVLNKPECAQTLRETLDNFHANFGTALDQLEEASPDVPIVVMTLYNPFDFLGALGEVSALSLEGQSGTDFPEGMNDIIEQVAAEHSHVRVADVYSAFKGRTAGLLFTDFIHPNDAGYRLIADTFIAEIDIQSNRNAAESRD